MCKYDQMRKHVNMINCPKNESYKRKFTVLSNLALQKPLKILEKLYKTYEITMVFQIHPIQFTKLPRNQEPENLKSRSRLHSSHE